MLNFPTDLSQGSFGQEGGGKIHHPSGSEAKEDPQGLFGSLSHHAFGFHSVMTRSQRKKGFFWGPSTMSQGQHAVLVLGVVSHFHVWCVVWWKTPHRSFVVAQSRNIFIIQNGNSYLLKVPLHQKRGLEFGNDLYHPANWQHLIPLNSELQSSPKIIPDSLLIFLELQLDHQISSTPLTFSIVQ